MLKIILFIIFLGGIAEAKTATKKLVYCMEGSPATLNPQLATDSISINASSQTMFNRLVQLNHETKQIEPSLATSWTISKDHKTYTFKLRKNVAFHSNEFFKPSRFFNADDVIYSFKSQMDSKYPLAIPAGGYEFFKAMQLDEIIADVIKIDSGTVVFKLKKAEAPFLADLKMDFASQLSAEYAQYLIDSGKGLGTIATHPIGTGPFSFKSYQKDSNLRFSAFANYFDTRPKIEELIYVIASDSNVRLQKTKVGECDVMSEPQPQEIENIKTDKNFNLFSTEGLNIGYVAFNNSKKPFDNLKVREALSFAMNKKSYINLIYNSQGTVAKNPIPPGLWSYDASIKDDEYNIEKAKKTLTEAGFPDGFKLELWTLPVSRPYMPNGKKLGELIQADLAKIKVTVKLQTYDWATYLEKSKNGDYDMIEFGWTGSNGDPDNFFGVLLTCSAIQAGSNYAHWCNSEFDQLIKSAKEELEQSKRSELYKKAQQIFKKEKPWVPIAHSRLNKVTHKNVIDFQMDSFGHVQFEKADIR